MKISSSFLSGQDCASRRRSKQCKPFTTKTHDNVVLQKKVAAGKKKGSIIMRDKIVTVTKIDPRENLALALEGLMIDESSLPDQR